MSIVYANPILDILDDAGLPTDLADFLRGDDGSTSVLDNIFYTDYAISSLPNGIAFNIGFAIPGEIAINVPGVDDLALVIGAGGEGVTEFRVALLATDNDFELRLEDVTLALRVPPSILKPVSDDDTPPPPFAQIETTASIVLDRNLNISIEGGTSLSLAPCEVAGTGVIISVDQVTWNFERGQTLSAATAAGLIGEFLGVAFDHATIKLPASITNAPDLLFDYCLIGTGGLTSRFHATWSPVFDATTKRYTGEGAGELLGVPFAIFDTEIEFKLSALLSSKITGKLLLPFFDEYCDINVGFNFDGSLTAQISSADGLLTLTKPGLLQMKVDSVGLEIKDGVLLTKLAGEITPLIGTAEGNQWPSFRVDELSIDSHGNVHLDGGWLNLRDKYTVKFHGFEIEVSKLGFGKNEDGSKWMGFTGGLKLVGGMPAGASVEGLRLTWYDDGSHAPALSMNGVKVNFEVPNTLKFAGEVAYNDVKHEFRGAVKLDLLALNMQVDATAVFGMKDGDQTKPYFALYLAAEFPAGIPLAATGLGLYGAAGLFAMNMEPDRAADQPWYQIGSSTDWYHKPDVGVTSLAKWKPVPGSMAFGAGVTLGTVADNGHTFSGRMLLAIVFPGPILLLQGAANLLQERASLDKEANFQALAVLDGRAGTLQLGLDAKYRYDSNGNLIDINGSADAFFDFNNPNAWHLNVGLDEPRDRRLHASLFKLFDSYAYVMLNSQQLAMGAWVGFQQTWNFGPLSVGLEAWIDGNARVSWKPAHFYGDLALHGSAKLSVFGFSAGITVDAQIAADVFDPLHITGDFSVAIDLPWPLPDFSAGVNLEWGPLPTRPPFPLPLKEVAIEHFKASTSWTLPRDPADETKRMLFPNFDRDADGFWDNPADSGIDPKYKRTQPLSLDDLPIVPLDSRPHLTFARNINDDALIGVNAMPVNPEFERIGDPATNQGPATIRYGLNEVVLDKWTTDDNGAPVWKSVARKGMTANDNDLPTLFGSWAPLPLMPGGGGRNVGQVKLWLWSKTPFEYTRRTNRAWDEWFTDEHSDYPCQTVIPEGWNFDNIAVAPDVQDPFFHPDERGLVFTQHIINVIRVAGFSIEQLEQPSNGLHHAFGISGKNLDGTTMIALPQATNLARVMITDSRLVDPTRFRSFDSKGHECIGFAGGTPDAPYVDIAGEGLTTLFYHAGEYKRFTLAQNLKGVRGTAYDPQLHRIILVEFNTGTLSSVDVNTGEYKVLGTGYLKPIDVVLTADGTTAYITEDVGTLLRVDLASGKADRSVAIVVSNGMSEPCQIALDETNRKAYVVELSGKARLLSIELAGLNAGRQTTIVSGLIKPFGLLLAKDGVTAYVCELGDGPIHTRLSRINVLKRTTEILFNDIILTFFLRWENEDQNAILAMQVDPDGNWLARFDIKGTSTKPEELERNFPEQLWGVVVLPNDRYVVCGETKLMMFATKLLITRIIDVGGSVFSRHFGEEFARWRQAGEVLEPHTKYRLQVKTATRMVGEPGGQLDGLDETKTLTEYAYFRTAGPPGVAELTAPAGSEAATPPGQKALTPLDDLSRYVRKTMPPTVAPTPTTPVPSQLAYRAYDIGVEFDENYVDLMYRIGRRDLSIHMHDSNGAIRNDEGHRLILANQWSQAETITLRDHEDRWISMLGSNGCNLVPINSIVKDTTFNATTVAHVLPPSSLCEARLIPALLHDGFGNYEVKAADGPVGTLDRWQVRDLAGSNSHWQITDKPSDSELSQTTQNATTVLVWGNAPTTELPDTDADQPLNWTDYRLTADLEFTDGRVGMVFRYRGVGQHYRFVMDKGTTNSCELIRVANGGETSLATNTEFKLPTIPFTVSVEVTGDAFKVYVDGELILTATDSTIESGSVGFFTSGTKSAIFTDIYVDDFRTDAAVVHRFSFLSSRFKNFRDQMESFENKTLIASIADGANAAPFVSAAQPEGSALSDDESRAYDGLLALVPGIAATPVVRVTRVQQLRDAIAFLVQSPEPLDWKRTSVKVLRSPANRSTEVPISVLRKADGSGLMIVSTGPTPSGSFWPEDEYRFVFTYRRDNRVNDRNSDVLSEAGVTSPEVVTIVVPWPTPTQRKQSVDEIDEVLVPA